MKPDPLHPPSVEPSPREVVYVPYTGQSPLSRASSIALVVFLGSLAVLFLVLAASVVVFVSYVTSSKATLTSGITDSLQTAGEAAAQSARTVTQVVQDAADPLHPPRYAIQQDPEFAVLRTVTVGSALGDSQLYQFDVAAIEQRTDGSSPDQQVYARIHRHLLVPKVTKVLGITVHTDDAAQDYALYRGQEFAIGGQTYKVNWLSPTSQQIAIVQFRQSENATGPLVFDEP